LPAPPKTTTSGEIMSGWLSNSWKSSQKTIEKNKTKSPSLSSEISVNPNDGWENF
jgi:hypothetical protein